MLPLRWQPEPRRKTRSKSALALVILGLRCARSARAAPVPAGDYLPMVVKPAGEGSGSLKTGGEEGTRFAL